MRICFSIRCDDFIFLMHLLLALPDAAKSEPNEPLSLFGEAVAAAACV